MSCCGGNCGCGGSGCSCGNGCGGCKMYPDLTEKSTTTTETFVMGVAPEDKTFDGFEMAAGSENDCKCGANCSCGTCGCHK